MSNALFNIKSSLSMHEPVASAYIHTTYIHTGADNVISVPILDIKNAVLHLGRMAFLRLNIYN